MVSARKVVKVGGQLVIAIPPEYRKALGASPGRALYWHPGRKGEAVLALASSREGGKPPDPQKSAAIAALEAEVYRLNARLERQRASLWNEWQSQATLKKISLELKGYPALDAINARLSRIEEVLSVGRWPRVRAPREPRSSAPPPAVVPIAGEAATPGAAPPGGP